jgi:nickel transport system substrate-binding protein
MFAQSMVYEPLVKYQADGSVKPWLATAGPTLRTESLAFTLRDDVHFPTASRLTPRPRRQLPGGAG